MATVLVPLAQGCEELEAITIIDLLRRAQIDVTVAGLEAGPVKASRGTVILPDVTLDQAITKDYDMIVLPGGLPGATHLQNDERLQRIIKKMSVENKYTAAICAAPKALASAGLLDNKRATSYPGTIDTKAFPSIMLTTEAITIDGKVITSRGPGTAMDFALTLIQLLAGEAMRDEVEHGLARPMEHLQLEKLT